MRFVRRLQTRGVVTEILPTPAFALPRSEFQGWARDRTRFRLEDFYREQRRRFSVLMDGDQPVGGRWNYDTDNRESPPKGEAKLERRGPVVAATRTTSTPRCGATSTPRASTPSAPTGRDCSRSPPVRPPRRSTQFIAHRLATVRPLRGRHLGQDWAMAHSLLSVPLNLGPAASVGRGVGSGGRLPRRCGPTARGGGLHPPDPGLARVHVAAVLALRPRVPRPATPWTPTHRYRTGGPTWTPTPSTAECLRAGAGRGTRPRLGAPHPAADGAGQPRPAARLPAPAALATGSPSPSSTDSTG